MTQPSRARSSPLDPHALARRAAELALEKNAKDPVLLDLRELTSLCDWYVVVAGESEPQVKAIAERIEQGLKEAGETPWHVEGRGGRQWILLDYVDVVVHVFHTKLRDMYMLERLWGDAPRETVDAGTDGS